MMGGAPTVRRTMSASSANDITLDELPMEIDALDQWVADKRVSMIKLRMATR
jgi:hypothetical protein